jgi:hypothetical protein
MTNKNKTAWDHLKTFAIDLVRPKTKDEQIARQPTLAQFFLHLGIYAVLVVGYFLIVITSLSTFLKDLFDQNLPVYAVVAWALIAGQGVLLEIIAVAVQRIIRAVRSEND